MGRVEALQQPQFGIQAVVHRRVGPVVDLPAPVALGLQQEHVVLVDVGADRAAGGGEAHHHVVDPPARQEIEVRQQGGDVGVPLVHVLHQQGPVVVGQLREHFLRERPVAQHPFVLRALVRHDPRQHPVLAGQAGEILGVDRRFKAREGVADQQRPLLPVVAQEVFRRHAQRRQRAGVDFDRWGTHGESLARSGRGVPRQAQISRASFSARPVYEAGVRSSRRCFSAAGRSSDSTNARIDSPVMPWPRVSALSCS